MRMKPLILIIEDLHWVDAASSALLFHLSRELENSRILLLGTYRPEETLPGQGEEEHPLAGIGYVLAGWVAGEQCGEVGIGIAGGGDVPPGGIRGEDPIHQTFVFARGRQSFQIVGVVDVRVAGVQPYEAVGCGAR